MNETRFQGSVAEIIGRKSIRKREREREREAERDIERKTYIFGKFTCMYACRVSQKDIKRYGGMACASHWACDQNRACQP